MLLAQLHHKLSRPEEQSEDLLTSNVFGAFKYSANLEILRRFLERARFFGSGLPLTIGEVRACKYRFWPWLCGVEMVGAEPDVVLLLTNDEGKKILVGVEAKYRSGKSSKPTNEGPPNDQLAREWLVLRAEMQRVGADSFYLVYLTADFGMPRKDISESLEELNEKGVTRSDAPADIAWLSFRQLPRLLNDASEPILCDLHTLLRDAMLIEIEPVTLPPAQLPPAFQFRSASTTQLLAWPISPAFPPYSFESKPSRSFIWPEVSAAVAYTFDACSTVGARAPRAAPRPPSAFHWPSHNLPPNVAWSFSR